MVDNILTKEIMLEFAYHKGKIVTRDFVSQFSVSRQYVSSLISDLVAENKLIKIGSTKKAFYVLPAYAEKHKDIYPIRYQTAFSNSGLEEHRVLDQIERAFPPLKELPENVSSIFAFAFSGMLNNAIEHSESSRIGVEVAIQNETLSFVVSDSGLGVFRNIKKKRKLGSELEAIQDLMKGKTTTMPKSHSGEGIFFTSKVGDLFVLDSYGRIFIVDNKRADVFIDETKKLKIGTKVIFKINTSSPRHLNEVFEQYANQADNSDLGFDKTLIQVKLYTIGGVHVSRSQARRILSGLDKFKIILFDFNKVPLVGQAFADEIFRVFHNKHPDIRLETE
ncbi:MAG: DUF4325 domain-containing protein, partial [Candidatus Margulisiibacteriota bacterium]